MRIPLLSTILLLAGCTTAVTPAPRVVVNASPDPSEKTPVRLPAFVVASSDTELRLPEDEHARIAFPRRGLPLQVREIHGEDVFVEIDGAVKVAGATRLQDLAVVVCEPGPLGEHGYAGNGNQLRLRSGVENGKVHVAGQVRVRQQAYSKDVPFEKQFRRIPVEGEIEVSRLCAAPLPPRHAGTAEDPFVGHGVGDPDAEDFPSDRAIIDVEKNRPLTLLDAPGGKTLITLPANTWGFPVVRVKHQGEWDLVAAGGGPYVIGWIPTRAPRDESAGGGLVGGLGMSRNGKHGPTSLYTRELEPFPLHALSEGTELQALGVVRARLNRPGYARATRTDGEWSFVAAAVDDDVVVTGWVPTAKLGEQISPKPTSSPRAP